VGGRPVAIYLLVLTTLTMPTMPTTLDIHSNTYIPTLSTEDEAEKKARKAEAVSEHLYS
jgi:hypothetical protein